VELHDYTRYDAIGLRDLIREREVSAAEIEAVARRALEAANAEVNALTLPLFSPALDHAVDGPLGGVPFLIKDSGPMAQGVPFACGSRSLERVVAEHDSELMTRFRAAGLVTLGVTTMPELGVSFSTESVKHGPTRNPWDLDHGVGGSSGGAAALVAAGAVPIAHGNDGAGSIRIPASCCGLVGLKPSRGRTPGWPDLFGMSCEFVLSRSVRDAAHCLDAIHGPRVGDACTAPRPLRPYAGEVGAEPAPLRVAVTTRAWSGVAVDPEVVAATDRVAGMLEQMGHFVSDSSPAVEWDAVIQVARGELVTIAAPFLMAPKPPLASKLEAVSRQIFKEVKEWRALDLVSAFEAQNRVSQAVGAFFTEHELLLTPTLGQLPAPHGTLQYDNPEHTATGWQRSIFDYGPFTAVFNICGQPAISLPLGHSQSGLPIGVQLVAPYGREDLLLSIAAALERAVLWKHQTPHIFIGKRTT
jgi:amidase